MSTACLDDVDVWGEADKQTLAGPGYSLLSVFFFLIPPSCPFHTFAITSLQISKHFSLHDHLSLHLHPFSLFAPRANSPVLHHTLRHINICMINEWWGAGIFFFSVPRCALAYISALNLCNRCHRLLACRSCYKWSSFKDFWKRWCK